MLSPKLALLTLGVVGLAYFLWTPLPDKLEKKAILRIGAVIKKTFGPMVGLMGSLLLFCQHGFVLECL